MERSPDERPEGRPEPGAGLAETRRCQAACVGPAMTTEGADLPDRARSWAEAHAPYPVTDVAPVGGGITGTKWVLCLTSGDRLVIRWSDSRRWGLTGREHVRREALALGLLSDSGFQAPQLVAADLDGEDAGAPAILMNWRPGHTRLDPLSPAAVTELANLAVAVHRFPVPSGTRPPVFSFRGPDAPEVPGWARWPGLWRRAIAIRNSDPPPTPYGLLHRDFHFGNVLWRGDRITGLIDWAEASLGPADLDVAHLCSDFAMLQTTAAAWDFRAEYLRQGGRLDPDPDAARFWMVSDIIGFLPDPAHILAAVGSSRPDLEPGDVRRGLEDLLAETLG